MTAGFAVFAFAALGAGPALADDAPELKDGTGLEAEQAPQTLDAPIEDIGGIDVSYTCASGGQEGAATFTWFFTVVPEDTAKTGDVIGYSALSDDYSYYEVPGAGNATSLSVSSVFGLSGGAAPSDQVTLNSSWSGNAEDPYAVDEIANWDLKGISGALDVTEPGDLVFTPGTVTTTLVQEDGTSTTTTCTPSSTPEVASITVTGDPVGGDDGDGGDNPGGGDGDGGDNPGGGDGDGGDNPGGGDGDGGDGQNPGGDEGDKGGDKGDDKPAPGDG
ncbi:hypothetical protein, partial [Nocardiopsis halophila]|uniref:hypothetical protein n=1 Tax=Nocardiopsis halophila TaxID=141692 RepID=UPI000476931B